MKRSSGHLLPLAAALAACMLFSSCVRWNIGAAIRDAADERIGVDLTQPMDGKVYVLKREAKPAGMIRGSRTVFAAHAPEVSYHQQTPWIEFDEVPLEPPHSRPAVKLRPTGRTVLASFTYEREPMRGFEFKYHAFHPLARATFREELDALPPEANLCPESALARLVRRASRRQGKAAPKPKPVMPQQPIHTVASLGTREYRRNWLATIAAAPFDYAIDPVLTGVSTGVFWVGAAVAAPFVYGYATIREACQP